MIKLLTYALFKNINSLQCNKVIIPFNSLFLFIPLVEIQTTMNSSSITGMTAT